MAMAAVFGIHMTIVDHTVGTYPNNFTSQAPSYDDAYFAVPSYQGNAYPVQGSDMSGANTSTSTFNAFVSNKSRLPIITTRRSPCTTGLSTRHRLSSRLTGVDKWPRPAFLSPGQPVQFRATSTQTLRNFSVQPRIVTPGMHGPWEICSSEGYRQHTSMVHPSSLSHNASMGSTGCHGNDRNTSISQPTIAGVGSEGSVCEGEGSEEIQQEETQQDRKARAIAASQQETARAMRLLYSTLTPTHDIALFDNQSAKSRYDWEGEQAGKTGVEGDRIRDIIGNAKYDKLKSRVNARRYREVKRKAREQPGKTHRISSVYSMHAGTEEDLRKQMAEEEDPEKKKKLRNSLSARQKRLRQKQTKRQ
ncbi:hypothetical protein QFC24_003867 [Naganishia onofrii]|uniref:Uncharacterized protein n=1 Tax=Naganishia onofrii TaxID=1851511 RepID=A0ACC2XIF9_9TREE|nr:hypothetical protein QFC24_003867 [Naganishia onofrii]